MLISISVRSSQDGPNLEIEYKLDPPPRPADVDRLEANSEPKWVCGITLIDDKVLLFPTARWKQYFHVDGPQHPTLYDIWITPARPEQAITMQMLPTIADMFIRAVENYDPNSDAKYESIVARAHRAGSGEPQPRKMKTNWDKQWYTTSSMSLDFRCALPIEGVKWLFFRARAIYLTDGVLNTAIIMLDRNGALVASGRVVDRVFERRKPAREGQPSRL